MKKPVFIFIILIHLVPHLYTQNSLEGRVEKTESKLESIESQLKSSNNQVLIYVSIATLAILGGFVAIRANILKIAKNEISGKVQKTVDDEVPVQVRHKAKDVLIDEFDKHVDAIELLAKEIEFLKAVSNDYKLQIVGNSLSQAASLREVLMAFGFKKENMEVTKMAPFPDLGTSSYKLTIFANMRGPQISLDEITEYVANSPDSTFFYHGGGHVKNLEPAALDRINFANSWYTFHPRVMETLRYIFINQKLQ